MSYHVTESQNNYYGTIVIKLANIIGLEQNKKYDYRVLRNDGNGFYKGYASFDIHNDEFVLIDSSFTLPDNPPPYESNSTIDIMGSQNGEVVLNTTISDIVDYGEKPIFNYDEYKQEESTTSNMSENLGEGIVINYDSDFSATVNTIEQNVNQTQQSTDSLPSWAENNNIYNPSEMEPIKLYTPPKWQQDPNMQVMGNDTSADWYGEEIIPASNEVETTEGITIVLSESAQWEETSEYYTFSLADNLELYIQQLDQYIPFTVLLQVNNSDHWQQNVSQWLNIEVYQLYGELNASYNLINAESTNQTNNPMGIQVHKNDMMGGYTKFRIEINFNGSMGDFDTVFNSNIMDYWGVELSSDYSLEENEDVRLLSNLTFETQELNVIPNQYDEDEDDSEEVIDEIKIKRDIREAIFELMYDNFIPSLNVNELNDLQQTIRDGQLAINRDDDELLVFTKKDGNVLQQMGDGDTPGDQITNDGGLVDSIYNILTSDGTDNSTYLETENLKATLSQLLTFYNTPFKWCITFLAQEYRYATKDEEGNWINVPNIPNLTKSISGVSIDKDKAKKILDTDIFELLPPQYDRQEDIDGLFSEKLITGNFLGEVPEFGEDGLISESELANDSGSRISEVVNDNAPITRLDNQANEDNQGKTIESLRNTLNQYLKDVDNVVEEIDDERPIYQNKSEGFLKLRKPNQAIIIRSFDDGELDFQKNDSYLTDGFTITMWVRFVGRTGNGTLFNYGNPYKEDVENRYGFRLETFTINNEDDLISNFDEQIEGIFSAEEIQPFGYSDYERFVRLVVWDNREGENKLYDSHFGTNKNERQTEYNLPVYFPNSIYGNQGHDDNLISSAFNYTRVPTDNLDEWFFICATYDPEVDMEVEDRAKVEIISRRDLLTARGFKVEETGEEEVDEENDNNSDDTTISPLSVENTSKEVMIQKMPDDNEILSV